MSYNPMIFMCNVCGLNDRVRRVGVWSVVATITVSIVCLQETKKYSFDLSFIHKICPKSFDAFEFLPSLGASGGVIT